MEGDFAGGHLANRDAPRGPRKGVTRGRLFGREMGGISDNAVVGTMGPTLCSRFLCRVRHIPYAGTSCICRGTAAPGDTSRESAVGWCKSLRQVLWRTQHGVAIIFYERSARAVSHMRRFWKCTTTGSVFSRVCTAHVV